MVSCCRSLRRQSGRHASCHAQGAPTGVEEVSARAIEPDADAGPEDEKDNEADAEADAETAAAEGQASDGAEGKLSFAPLPVRQRDLTAILLRADGMLAARMQKTINKQLRTQAAAPVGEITDLLDLIVGPLMQALLIITVITCIVAAVGILVSIYNSMNDRKRDIAVMRALGARRDTVMMIILLESLVIAIGGAIAGWFLAHLGVYAAGGFIEDRTGIQVGIFTVTQAELWVVPLVLFLAGLAGLLPAFVGYRTDVAKNLNP